MKFRSKDIIAALVGLFGYRLERIRRTRSPSLSGDALVPDSLPSAPFPAIAQLMVHLGHSEPMVFDVGGNKGDTVQEFLNLLPGSSVRCFEPFPEMVAALRERFGGEPRVEIVPKAVSREPGTTRFYVNELNATNSMLPNVVEGQRFYADATRTVGEIEVETIDLDSYCDALGIERVHLLKLDIQGAELMALGGCEGMLRSQRIDVIYTEIQFTPLYEGAAQFDEIWSRLRGLGYHLVDVYDLHRSAGGQILYGDALFVSQESKRRVLDRYRIDS